MISRRRNGSCWVLLGLCAGLSAWPARGAEPSDRAAMAEAISRAAGPGEQALILGRYAWPATPGDRAVAAVARERLVGYAHNAFRAYREALHRAGPLYSADITAAMIETRLAYPNGVPGEFLPALEDAVWFGSADAQRLAIPWLAEYHDGPAILACEDAMIDHPELTPLVARELGDFGDAQARFALDRLLRGAAPSVRAIAAASLTRLGALGLETLRDAMLSEDKATRQAALDAFLPASGTNDLTALYEYVTRRPDDDPAVLERVRQRAAMLEELLEQQQRVDSASSPVD